MVATFVVATVALVVSATTVAVVTGLFLLARVVRALALVIPLVVVLALIVAVLSLIVAGLVRGLAWFGIR